VLSQDGIVSAALQVVDSEGVDALSMRRVAQELGTGAASLYAHVADKAELLALVLDRVHGEVEIPAPDPEHWQEQVKAIMREGYRRLLAHGDLARVAMAHGVTLGPNTVRLTEGMLAIMRGAGVSEKTAAFGLDALALYVVATAAERAMLAREAAATSETVAEHEERVRQYFASLPADAFPHTRRMADALAGAEEREDGIDDERFEFGLDILVSGLAARAGGF
jgi:AcrR family transcriptional regulator